jgi:subtilisin
VAKGGGTSGGTVGQIVPAGISRIGAAPGKLPNRGAGVGVAIFDTGLDFSHRDLAVSSQCFSAFISCQDGNGHGTHVGGIVAALDNSVDVVGVAPQATLYGVKVLNDQGSGSDSTIIAGFDWLLSNWDIFSPAIRVVNMSLGRRGSLDDNPVLREAITMAKNLDITIVVAAGNDPSVEVAQMVPAGYPEVLAIASSSAQMGANRCRFLAAPIAADSASHFTSDGAFNQATSIGVTVSAPGESAENVSRACLLESSGILSLKAGGGTVRMSGTSMAAPHVAGVAALLVEAQQGAIDPETIRSRLRSTASMTAQAPYDSPVSSYSFDGEREGILSACGALGVLCQ